MPRQVTTRFAKSSRGWPAKTVQLAQVYAPFATQPFVPGAADRGGRVAVAANLHDVVGLGTFVLPPQAAANLEVDDALLLPFI